MNYCKIWLHFIRSTHERIPSISTDWKTELIDHFKSLWDCGGNAVNGVYRADDFCSLLPHPEGLGYRIICHSENGSFVQPRFIGTGKNKQTNQSNGIHTILNRSNHGFR